MCSSCMSMTANRLMINASRFLPSFALFEKRHQHRQNLAANHCEPNLLSSGLLMHVTASRIYKGGPCDNFSRRPLGGSGASASDRGPFVVRWGDMNYGQLAHMSSLAQAVHTGRSEYHRLLKSCSSLVVNPRSSSSGLDPRRQRPYQTRVLREVLRENRHSHRHSVTDGDLAILLHRALASPPGIGFERRISLLCFPHSEVMMTIALGSLCVRRIRTLLMGHSSEIASC